MTATQSRRDMGMVELRKYWTIVRLNPGRGKCEFEVAVAKEFLFSGKLSSLAKANKKAIQHQLWTLCRSSEASIRSHAALNLRCYISYAAKQSVDRLVKKYISISDKNILANDLYSCVLDDEGKLLQFVLEDDDKRLKFALDERQRLLVINGKGLQAVSQPFSFKVLATFEPNRSQGRNLANWTSFMVKQEPEVKLILREYGFHPDSLWRFLSKVKPEQLQYLEQHSSNFSVDKIAYHVQLLTVLRQVNQRHRREQLKSKSQDKGEKKRDHLFKMMLDELQKQSIAIASTQALKDELQKIRNFLCKQPREMCRSEALISGNYEITISEIISGTEFNDLEELEKREITEFYYCVQQQFQPDYWQKRLQWLDSSLQSTILNRLTYLQNSRSRKLVKQSSQYLPALKYLYVSGLSMGEIAWKIGLQHEYQVSRLLSLPALLKDSQNQMLVLLKELFFNWAKQEAAAEHLQILEEQPGIAIQLLEEPIADILSMFKQAQAEKHNYHHYSNSLVAQHIRHFLIGH